MEDDDKDTVVPEPEETKATPETPPVVTAPDDAKEDVRGAISELKQRIDDLTETVTQLAPVGEQDSRPVKKPWTHWGNR